MLIECFEKNANLNKNKTALITRDGSWSFGELSGFVKSISNEIRNKKIRDFEPVGLAFPNCMEFASLILGSLMAGTPSVLLGSYLKPRELLYHVENIGIRIVLASPRLENVFLEAGGVREASLTSAIDCWRFNTEKRSKFQKGDFICQLTSGTNGIPKAVIRTEEAVWTEVAGTAELIRLSGDDKFLTLPPIHHSYGLIGGTLVPLCLGAQLALSEAFMPADVLNMLGAQRVTVLFAVPFMYHLLNQAYKQRLEANRENPDLSSLRLCLSAGAPMKAEIAKEFKNRFNRQICQDYGSTETGVMCINLKQEDFENSVGLPVGDYIIRAFDENGNELPVGTDGELRIKSNATARVYLYPEELNSTAFSNGWFCTGDTGRIEENGYVYVSGRKSSLINVSGMKVDPVEVENIIMQFPGVKDAAVVGLDSGYSGQIIKAYIVASEKIDESQLILFCRKNMASFKVPRAIEFLEELPRSQTGKVLRKYLINNN